MIGDSDVNYDFYAYSDFMSIDLAGTQTELEWNHVDEAYLQTIINGSVLYATVRTNTNSLIYLYQYSRIASPYSHLECTVNDDGTLFCVSGEKDNLYVCDQNEGIRHGATVLDNCSPVTISP